ncbi:hypothetical protein KP509_04G062500 [Ceratopteris richardii]|uniref:Uncharacterized protein n=1 Tax=Ceratopteris richardii TaxID=49495 RepID=A0A8T2UW28_CERRI|nr:hypothetical protein KP509_1Z034000 [Ceratopteris richardii]KAH7439462.1 hypothetical protein KP509_04G062500 [Ceratopteris richardii]
METARNVTLNTSTMKLTGSVQRFDSSWQNFELNLDYNVENIEGRLVWLLNPHVPYFGDENGRSGFGSYDASDDPELVEYVNSIIPHRPPRTIQITLPGSRRDKIDIARIIAK